MKALDRWARLVEDAPGDTAAQLGFVEELRTAGLLQVGSRTLSPAGESEGQAASCTQATSGLLLLGGQLL